MVAGFGEITGGRKKKAVEDCCCTGSCCCLPVDYTNPLYPRGVLQNIPFEITAPGCVQLDGDTGTFVPIDPTSIYLGGCGPCAGFVPVAVAALPGINYFDVGGMCMPTPCSINLCLMLTCEQDEQAVNGGLDECCSRLRLWVGSSVQQVEDDGSRPDGDLTAVSCTSWKKVSPSQCVCNPLSARFPLSLNFNCGTISGGACDGQPNCCVLTCDLTGAEVVI
jgi:hypothetical protein